MALRFLFLSMLVIGLSLVGYVAFGLLPNPPSAAPTAATASLSDQVLVAARPISAGMLLRAEDVRWDPWPLGAAPEGTLTRGRSRDEAYNGAVTRRAFATGEPIIAGQIVAPGERGFLAAVLSPGKRGVSVAVDAASATGGLIWPGDRVDLLLTQSFESEQGRSPRKAVGETILRDLRVIAIDQQLGAGAVTQQKGAVETRIPRTVTLEVSAAEAEAVSVAVTIGKLSLALRSLASKEEVTAMSADAAFQARSAQAQTWADDVSPALRLLPAAPIAPTGRPGLRIIHGSKVDILER